MLRVIKLILLILLSSSVDAQRFLETVRDPANSSWQDNVLNNKVIIAGNAETSLLSYNDETFDAFAYPTLSGVPLKFSTYNNPLTFFQSALFFSLTYTSGGVNTAYLYRFSGTIFSRITTTGSVISNCVVLGDNLYFLVRISGVTKLYRYNGTLTELSVGIPNSSGYKLHISQGYMYISGYASATGTTNFIIRFNGSSYLTLPWSGSGTNVQDAYRVAGTNRVYFTSHERILYYDGSTVRQVFYNPGESVYARLWRDNLYFTTGVTPSSGPRSSYLYRLVGPTLSLMPLPAGASITPVGSTNPEVFRDELYVAMIFTDGRKKLMKHDGIAFLSVFDIPGSVVSGVLLFPRNNELIIQPNFPNGNNAFEYNGTTFTEIIGVPGRLMFPWINGTNCNHLWLNYYTDVSGIRWAIAKEPLGCPPPGMPVLVIPEHFKAYERFDHTTYGPERGWCWSEIIIDWDIVPYCPLPPCPLPNYQSRMMDANNAVVWAQNFNQPSVLQVPLPDVQGYKTVLSSTDAGKDLLVFEPNLVEKGIGSITLNMKPKQNYFLLSATTKNNQLVPLTVTLLNSKGAKIWEKTFNAPFSQQIQDTVQEPGQMLVFSVGTMMF